jgi:TolB-like protein
MGRTVRRKCKKITGQEKISYCPSGAEKKGIISRRPHLEYLSKKNESRSKRKDKVTRSLDENIITLLKRRVPIFFINNKQDAR